MTHNDTKGWCLIEYSKENRFYVYIWYIVETKEVFYVGKGTGDRYKKLTGRNKFFVDMYNSHHCAVRKIYTCIDEKLAFMLERITIYEYRRKHPEYRLTNQTDGGEGVSGWEATPEYREHMRVKNMGAGNPNYNNRWSQEQKDAMSKRIKESGIYKGALNPKATKVMCVETGIIYECILDALSAYAIKDHSNMSAALRDPVRTAGGVHWAKNGFDDLDTPEKREEYLLMHKRKFNGKPIPVMCLESGSLYCSIAEFISYINAPMHIVNKTLNKNKPMIHNNKTYVVMQ